MVEQAILGAQTRSIPSFLLCSHFAPTIGPNLVNKTDNIHMDTFQNRELNTGLNQIFRC